MTITIIERREKRKGAKWKAWTLPQPQTKVEVDYDVVYWAREYRDYTFRARKYAPVRGK